MKRWGVALWAHAALLLDLMISPSIAGAAPVVIDFEDLPGHAVPVLDHYASQGILLDAVALDYSTDILLPNFAHSGTKGIEQCFAQEFCTAPIAMTFTAPQGRVKVWAGFSSHFDATGLVVLRAFNAAGAPVGVAQAPFDFRQGPIPIQTPLEVVSTGVDITRATVSIEVGGQVAATNSLAVDDVEFDAGPPPACGSTQDPTVTVAQPADGQTFQFNQFLLQFAVTTGDPFATATVQADGPGGTSHTATYPGFNGPFGPLWIHDFLFPGANTLTVTVNDCKGTASRGVNVTYAPIAAGARFEVQGIEVTQAIQDLANDATLIADKRTVVRVYLRVTGAASPITGVRGTLNAAEALAPYQSDALGPPLVPYNLRSLNAIAVDSSTDVTAQRRSLDTSLNFALPPAWIQRGFLHLNLSLDIDGSPTSPAPIPCDGCDNVDDGGHPVLDFFQDAPPVRVRLVRVPYTTDGANLFLPRQLDLDMLMSWLRRAYPTGDVLSTQITLDRTFSTTGDPFGALDLSCQDVNAALAQFELIDPTGDFRTHTYGLVSDAGGEMQGCAASAPGRFASGPAGAPTLLKGGWDLDGSYADWYGGHELGHTYGRKHPGDCNGNSRDDLQFPYPGGSISGPDPLFFGFDVGDAGIVIPDRVPSDLPPQPYLPSILSETDGFTDVMTYCDREWLSDYTYEGILSQLRLMEAGGPAGFGPASAPVPALGDTLLMVGTLNLTQGTAVLEPFSRVPGLRPTPRPDSSAFSIDLRDGAGRLLARYPFEPQPSTDTAPGGDQIALVAEVVPYAAGTRRIVVARDGAELGSRAVSDHAPKVHLTFPNGGETLDSSSATVTWQATDADGDALTYALLYSPDAGATWQSVAVGLPDPHAAVDLRELPGGDRALFRVIATDGVNTAIDETDAPFRVPVKAPQVRIVSPADGSTYTTAQTVVFNGLASDLQDGNLSGASLRWRADRDGRLGAGRSISVTGWAPGVHTVTLTATNRAGAVGAATVRVNIVPAGSDQPAGLRLGILNGDFATGDLTGWRADGIQGGLARVVQSGHAFSSVEGSDPIPFPGGPGRFAAEVRSSVGAPVESIGILTSDPFLPNASALTFRTLSESAHVGAELLVLRASADVLDPGPADILARVPVVNPKPGTGSGATFRPQRVDLSPYYNPTDPIQGTPLRIQIRQHTTEAGAGGFTLVTGFRAGAVAPLVTGSPADPVAPSTFAFWVPGQPQSPLTLVQGDPPLLLFHLVGMDGHVRKGQTALPSLRGCGTIQSVQVTDGRVVVRGTGGNYVSRDGFLYVRLSLPCNTANPPERTGK